MINYISKILYILPKSWRKSIFYITILTLFNAIFELMGIGLVIPFLSIFLGEPNTIVNDISFLKNMEKEVLISFFIFIFLIIFIFKNLFLLFFQKIKINFSYELAKKVSTTLYLRYLKKNYIFFTFRNTSELIRNTTAETHMFSFGVMVPILTLISDSIIFLTILIFLIVYNPIATLIAAIVMILFSFVMMIFQLNKLKLYGEIRQEHANSLLKLVSESIGNIKEIILSSNQQFFADKFLHHNEQNAKVGKKRDFFFILTRPVLEVLTILMFLILVYILINFGSTSSEIFVILGVFSFASIKLVPTIGSIMKHLQGLRYNIVVVDLIYNEMLNKSINYNLNLNTPISKDINLLEFKKIKFSNVNYSYPKSSSNIFEKINIEINKGDKVGFIGQSGSGKTTLINLLTGLIEPTDGIIEINDKNINLNIKKWQNAIGYVSQSVYLADESFLFNITLNKVGNTIDMNRVNHLIEILDLKTLINSKKDGLKTTVGEKGIAISGGQIQRIGIARALYNKPKILILDEATNALDEDTQNRVLKNIYNEMENETVISVSHDKRSLKYCKKVFSVKKNELVKIVL